jgi:hypothetical protein
VTAVRPTRRVLDVVLERDAGLCAWCGGDIGGTRGWDWSLHHRRPAGAGGDRRPETHGAGNLILLHGSGCTRCHGVVESSRAMALDRGFLIPKGAAEPPSEFPIQHFVHGYCRLFDDGSWEAA